MLVEPDCHCVSDAVFRQHLGNWAVVRSQCDRCFLLRLRCVRIDCLGRYTRCWKIQVEISGKRVRNFGGKRMVRLLQNILSSVESGVVIIIVIVGNLEFVDIQPSTRGHGDSHGRCLRHRNRAAHAQRAFLHRKVIAAGRQV